MPDPAWLQEVGRPETRILLTGSDAASPAEVEAWIDARYAAPAAEWTRMNMIGAFNGRIAGPDGTSDTLSNRADRRILNHLRCRADAILVGAHTVRIERHTATRPAWLCVITGSGDLSGHRISPEDAAASVLVCGPEDARARAAETMPGAQFAALPLRDGRLALPAVLAELRGRGLRQLIVEGGNRLISQFLDEGLLDEVCLTQAPLFGADDAPSLPSSTRAQRWHRDLLLEDACGYLYQRLRARPTAS